MKRIIKTKKFLALLAIFAITGPGLGPSQVWASLMGGSIQGKDLNITSSNAAASAFAGSTDGAVSWNPVSK